jgi:hypothetical protein
VLGRDLPTTALHIVDTGNCFHETLRINHRVGRVQSFFLRSSELGLPQPLTRRRVCPPPSGSGGRGTLAGKRGVGGESQFRRGTYTVVFFIYMYFVVLTIVDARKMIYSSFRELLFRELPNLLRGQFGENSTRDVIYYPQGFRKKGKARISWRLPILSLIAWSQFFIMNISVNKMSKSKRF